MIGDPPAGTAGPDTSGVTTWRRAANFERGIYSNLYRWLARRPDLGPDGASAFGYVEVVRTTIWVWIGASALEMALVHLVVPWPVARWILLIVSAWGLIWMLGYLGGLVIHPHLVGPDRLVVRNGHTIEVPVPAPLIAAVTTGTSSLERSRVVQLGGSDGDHLYLAMSSQVNVHLDLTEPLTVDLPGGRYTFGRLSCWADDPGGMAAAIRTITG